MPSNAQLKAEDYGFIVGAALADYVDDFMRLGQRHRDELATHPDLMVFDPDVERYLKLDELGVLLVVLATYCGEVVGYSISAVGPHMHYKALMYAHNDVLYIAPEHRRGGLGAALVKQTEASAEDCGCRMVLFHAKPGTPFDDLLQHMGYGVQDIMRSKEV